MTHVLFFSVVLWCGLWLGTCSAVDVLVNSPGDSLSNATACENANNTCTLRSAFSYCALNSSTTTLSMNQCRIILPPFGAVEINASLGPIDVTFSANSNVEVILEGSGASVTIDEASASPLAPRSGLARLHGNGVRDILFHVYNISFAHFTESVLYVKDIRVVLEDVKFLNNSAETGAALHLHRSAHSNITRCFFQNNIAEIEGGAMYLEEYVTHLTVSLSTFSENQAQGDGGAVYVYGYNEHLTLVESNFTDNLVFNGDGGAVYSWEYNHYFLVEDSLFVNNSAILGRGGAIYSLEESDHFSVISTTFSGNKALQSSGGALFFYMDITDILIEACIFSQNYAATNGGAVVLYSDINDVVFHRNEFLSNIASISGGAVYLFISIEDVNITDSVFIGNVANSGDELSTNRGEDLAMGGGAVYIDVSNARILLARCSLHNNSAPYASGGSCFINSNNHDITLRECNQTFNYAYRSGGSLYVGSANTHMFVQSSVMAYNTADVIGGGGCMMLAHNSVTFINTIVRGNHAKFGGGLLSFLNNIKVDIQNCVIEDNSAIETGGGVKIGILHDLVSLDDTQFLNNRALKGGALAIDTGNYVTIGSCLFTGNSVSPIDSHDAIGGAIYSISDNLHITLSTFEKNIAHEGGAAVFSGRNISLTRSVFTSNIATESAGALELTYCSDVLISACNLTGNGNMTIEIESSSFIAIFDTRVANSIGTDGSAIAAVDTDQLRISNSFFKNNSGSGLGGALYFIGSSKVQVENSIFVSNRATKAGAISVEQSTDVTLYVNTFRDNHASVHGGGAVSILSSTNSTIRLNSFENNSCEGGGGAVFWSYNGGEMLEPFFLTSNQFIGNLALYGNDLATDGVSLMFRGNSTRGEWSEGGDAEVGGATIVQVTAYNQDMLWPVELVDMYGQVVANQDAVLEAWPTEHYACGDEGDAYLTGQTMAPIVRGETSLLFTPSCDPKGYLRVAFSTNVNLVPDLEIELRFRTCWRGEYYSHGACVQCPNGTYSLVDPSTQDEPVISCSVCPTHATCYGDVILVDEGYWRVSSEAADLFDCPLDGSCPGGENVGKDQCNEGFTGVLCGVCDKDYYYPSLAATCVACSDGHLQVGFIILIVFVSLVSVGLFISLCGGRISQEFNNQTGISFVTKRWKARTSLSFKTKKNQFLESEDSARKYQNKLKQLITLFQILSAFPSVLSTTFPSIYYQLTSAFNFITNLGGVLKDLGLVCSFNGLDYISTVVGVTVMPIVASLALFFVQKLHCYWVLHQYSPRFRGIANTYSRIEVLKSTYQYVFLFFTYLILPGVSTVLFGMLKPCTDIDPSEMEGGNQHYLEADWSIRCEGPRYRFGVTWAIFGCLLYPIGVPCFYFYLLYRSKHLIQTRAHINVQTLDQNGLDELEKIGMQLSSLKFLFQEYQPKFWYFEIIETLRKLFLTSVLSVISPGSTKQLVYGNLFVVVCLIVYIILSPFDDLELTTTSAICQLQIWFILFLSILIKENVHISSTFIHFSVAFAILFILVYEAFWCVVEFCPLPKRVRTYFDRKFASKSHPSPPPTPSETSFKSSFKSSFKTNKSTIKSKENSSPNAHVEKAIGKLMKLLTDSRDEDLEQISHKQSVAMTDLDAKAVIVQQNLELVEKLTAVLNDHQSLIAEKINTLGLLEELSLTEDDDVENDQEYDLESPLPSPNEDRRIMLQKSFLSSHRFANSQNEYDVCELSSSDEDNEGITEEMKGNVIILEEECQEKKILAEKKEKNLSKVSGTVASPSHCDEIEIEMESL